MDRQQENLSVRPQKPMPEESTQYLSRPLAPGSGWRLGLLALLGAGNALWALFLWGELVRARGGAEPFCAFGASGCGDLWDASFASTVHNLSGLPVAGWGLLWGLVAFLLPVVALAGHADARRTGGLGRAIKLTAVAGVGGVLVLLAVSLAAGSFCSSCAVTYVLTLGFGVLAFSGLRIDRGASWGRGLAVATAVSAGLYLLLLLPGLKTPRAQAEAGRSAIAAGAPSDGEVAAADPEATLATFIDGLEPAMAQNLSDVLDIYRTGPEIPPQPARAPLGAAEAPVRITEFTDVLCGHCAELHETFAYLWSLVAYESFNVDARHFPLDGHCNPHMSRPETETVRCMAAKAQICMEDATTEARFRYTGALYDKQPNLSAAEVYALAKSERNASALEACIDAPETAQKLADDIAYAWRFEPKGTPIVLVNGRRGVAFGPFLYAIIVAGGDPDHPAFASLPAPRPRPNQ